MNMCWQEVSNPHYYIQLVFLYSHRQSASHSLMLKQLCLHLLSLPLYHRDIMIPNLIILEHLLRYFAGLLRAFTFIRLDLFMHSYRTCAYHSASYRHTPHYDHGVRIEHDLAYPLKASALKLSLGNGSFFCIESIRMRSSRLQECAIEASKF